MSARYVDTFLTKICPIDVRSVGLRQRISKKRPDFANNINYIPGSETGRFGRIFGPEFYIRA